MGSGDDYPLGDMVGRLGVRDAKVVCKLRVGGMAWHSGFCILRIWSSTSFSFAICLVMVESALTPLTQFDC